MRKNNRSMILSTMLFSMVLAGCNMGMNSPGGNMFSGAAVGESMDSTQLSSPDSENSDSPPGSQGSIEGDPVFSTTNSGQVQPINSINPALGSALGPTSSSPLAPTPLYTTPGNPAVAQNDTDPISPANPCPPGSNCADGGLIGSKSDPDHILQPQEFALPNEILKEELLEIQNSF